MCAGKMYEYFNHFLLIYIVYFCCVIPIFLYNISHYS